VALRVTQVQQEIKASPGTRDTQLKSYSIAWRIVQELDHEVTPLLLTGDHLL
jgi:hypothetical protein